MIRKIIKKKLRRHKYDRRRALKCELLKKSDTHKGYCKYMVTIGEKDGTIHKQPVYGKDMQNALSRVINRELTVKVEKKLETSTGFVFLAWVALMGIPVIFGDAKSPFFLVYIFGSVLLMMGAAIWWYSYVNKGEIK